MIRRVVHRERRLQEERDAAAWAYVRAVDEDDEHDSYITMAAKAGARARLVAALEALNV